MASNNAPAKSREQVMSMATSEVDYRVEWFNKLTYTCFNKCIDKRFKEGELTLGENSCVDRCVSKYNQVNNLVGHILGSGPPTI